MRLLLTAVIVSAGFMLGQAAVAADAEAGAAKFKQLCATCHGDSGHGDGPASAALNPQPRDMTDHEWQESVDDDHIRTVIKDGGAAVGLSPTMTAFGHALSEEDLDNLAASIRQTDDCSCCERRRAAMAPALQRCGTGGLRPPAQALRS